MMNVRMLFARMSPLLLAFRTLALAFTTLSLGASGLWLALIGQWWALFAGLVSLAVSHYVIGVLLLVGLVVDIPAMTMLQRGKVRAGVLLGGISVLYTHALIVAWALAVLAFFASRSSPHAVMPLVVWSFGVATGPWSFLAGKDPDKQNEFSALSTVFMQLGYIAAIIIFLVSRSFLIAALAIALAMSLSWLLQMAVLCVDAGAYEYIADDGDVEQRASDDEIAGSDAHEYTADDDVGQWASDEEIAEFDAYEDTADDDDDDEQWPPDEEIARSSADELTADDEDDDDDEEEEEEA